MTKCEPENLPDKDKQERAIELAWISDNRRDVLETVIKGYQSKGRGAFILDMSKGDKIVTKYLTEQELDGLETLDRHETEKPKRMIRKYQPGNQFVAVVISDARVGTYQLGFL